MIRYGLLIVTFFLALSVSADNKNAVVRIYNYKSTNSVSCGTGFFVRLNNRTYIATAYHVIANSQKIEVYSFSGKLSNVTCVGHYILGDLALLSFDKPPSSITWLDIAKPPDNLLKTEAIAIGHPNSIKYQEFKIMFPNDKLMHCKEMFDNDSKPVFKFGVNLEIIPIYGGIYNGMSGAPLIVNGKVIGVLSGSLSQGGTYAWAIPTSNFLNIKFLPSPISDFRTFADYPYLNNTHRPLTRSATVIQQDEEDDLYNEGVLNYETTFLKIEENAKLVNYYNDQRTKIFNSIIDKKRKNAHNDSVLTAFNEYIATTNYLAVPIRDFDAPSESSNFPLTSRGEKFLEILGRRTEVIQAAVDISLNAEYVNNLKTLLIVYNSSISLEEEMTKLKRAFVQDHAKGYELILKCYSSSSQEIFNQAIAAMKPNLSIVNELHSVQLKFTELYNSFLDAMRQIDETYRETVKIK